MNFKCIEVITVAKVGSSDFLNSCKKNYPTVHSHSLLQLKKVINNKDTLILLELEIQLIEIFHIFFNHLIINFTMM